MRKRYKVMYLIMNMRFKKITKMLFQIKFDTFINLTNINNILYFLIVIVVIWYFIFTVRKDTPVRSGASQLGRYALMIAFGSAYGSITMAYLSLIIGQLEIIFRDTLHLIK